MSAQLVSLTDHGIFWFLVDEEGEGPLAPLDHCEDDGELVEDLEILLCADSYAHVFANGDIMRYGEIIGHKSDLTKVITAEYAAKRLPK